MTISRLIVSIVVLFTVQGCKIIQTVPEGGSIVSRTGMHDCASGATCEIDVVNGEAFSDTFTAVPDAGYEFVGWKQEDRFLCGGIVAPCALENVPGSFTDQDIDLFLEPVFEQLPNDGPTANAGEDQIVEFGDLVTLDGSESSDLDGSIETFTWLQTSGPDVTLDDIDTGVVQFNASEEGTYEFELSVVDDLGASDSDSVVVTVILANVPPSAAAGEDVTVLPGATVTLDGSGSTDSDGTIVEFSWVQVTNEIVDLNVSETGTVEFTAPDTDGTYEFELTVTDDDGDTGTDNVLVTVETPAPIILTTERLSGKTVSIFGELDVDEITFNSDGSGDMVFPEGPASITSWEVVDGVLTFREVSGDDDNDFYDYTITPTSEEDGVISFDVTIDAILNDAVNYILVGTGTMEIQEESPESDGIIRTDIDGGNEYARSIIPQTDGTFIVAGSTDQGSELDFLISRYLSDGSLDSTFVGNTGTGNGHILTDLNGGRDYLETLTQQSDGKFVGVGDSNNGTDDDFAIVRYNQDGTLDSNFGVGGIVITSVNANDRPNAIVEQSDGKLVVAGATSAGGIGDFSDFILARYETDGSLDTTFGSGGIVVTPTASNYDYFYDVKILPDSKILAAGTTLNTSSVNDDLVLVRYNSDGSLDATFDGDGILLTDIGGGNDRPLAVIVQDDGKLVLGGYATVDDDPEFVLVRYNADGTLDNAFGVDGVAVTPMQQTSDYAFDAIPLSDNGFLVIGESRSADSAAALLVRYTRDGSLDSDFGDAGIVTLSIGQLASAYAVAELSDGSLLVTGDFEDGSDRDIFVVRLKDNGSIATDCCIPDEEEFILTTERLNDRTVSIGGELDVDEITFNSDGTGDMVFPEGPANITSWEVIDGVLTFREVSGDDNNDFYDYTINPVSEDDGVISFDVTIDAILNDEVNYTLTGTGTLEFISASEEIWGIWEHPSQTLLFMFLSDGRYFAIQWIEENNFVGFERGTYSVDDTSIMFINLQNNDGEALVCNEQVGTTCSNKTFDYSIDEGELNLVAPDPDEPDDGPVIFEKLEISGSEIVGVWEHSSQTVVFIFLSDGRYFAIQTEEENGFVGFERGTFENDSSTLSFTTIQNNDGEALICNEPADTTCSNEILNYSVSDDELVISDPDEPDEGSIPFEKLLGSSEIPTTRTYTLNGSDNIYSGEFHASEITGSLTVGNDGSCVLDATEGYAGSCTIENGVFSLVGAPSITGTVTDCYATIVNFAQFSDDEWVSAGIHGPSDSICTDTVLEDGSYNVTGTESVSDLPGQGNNHSTYTVQATVTLEGDSCRVTSTEGDFDCIVEGSLFRAADFDVLFGTISENSITYILNPNSDSQETVWGEFHGERVD